MFPSLRPKLFVLCVLLITLLALTAVGLVNFVYDPYWIWHEEPLWSQNKTGSTPLLKSDMARAKKLYIASNPDEYEVFLVGSSRMYCGIDPDDMCVGDIYNFGISGLQIIESVDCIKFLVNNTSVKTIVLELDYFGFLDTQDDVVPPGIESDYPLGRLSDRLNSLFGAPSTVASLKLITGWKDMDGEFKRNVFKRTTWRSRSDFESLIEFFSERYAGRVIGQAYDSLREIFELTRRYGVELLVFLCPLHHELVDLIDALGARNEYDDWREEVWALASRFGLRVWDFSRENPYAASSLATGSNRYYADVSQYSPIIGRLIMKRLGFALAAPVEGSWTSFGVELQPHSTG